MRIFITCFFAILIAGFLACGNLVADTIAVLGPGLGTDTLSIAFDPVEGAVDGVAGATVGWGFTVIWTSSDNDWISFTSTTLGSVAQVETNPALLAAYTDYLSGQGGPDADFGLSPGTWNESFDSASQQGIGGYQIAADAGTGAEDMGQFTFYFEVYSASGADLGSYSYYGQSTDFSVTVDASAAPEPSSWLLFGGGLCVLICYRVGSLKRARL